MMHHPIDNRLLVAVILAALPFLGCGEEDPKFVLEKKPIPALGYHGFRQDIPASRRGNAVFVKGVFTREGRYLVTLGVGIRVWDAATGALLRTLGATLDGNDPLVADGTHHQVLARRGDVAPGLPDAMGLWIWDLRDGSRRGPIPEPSWAERAHPIGITPKGDAVVLREGRIETWALDGRGPSVALDAPPGRRFCEPADPIAHDKQCAELSRSGRWLALFDRDSANPMAQSWTWLADLERATLRRVILPEAVDVRGGHAFSFSPNEKTLALQVADGMWIGHPLERTAASDADPGRLVRGEHQRGLFLHPMAFTADGTGIVAMGDQFTVATYDAETGELRARVKPPFEDSEGALRVSANGSRAIAYRYGADILVVIDGATGRERGYLCPYFCNRAHNPVAVPYAVSPDGRRVATGGRLGAGLWDTDADTLIAPLMDPALPPLKSR